MLERYIRNYYQAIFVNPLARLLNKTGYFTPNWITLFAVITGVLAAIGLFANWPIFACILLLLSGYLDTLDGTLARLSKKNTITGTVLDITADRLVEFLIVLGLYSISPINRATVCLWLLGGFLLCVTSFLVVGIFTEKKGEKGFSYSPGLIERPETFLFFILMILFPVLFYWLAWLLVILVFYTAAMRIFQFYQQHVSYEETTNENN